MIAVLFIIYFIYHRCSQSLSSPPLPTPPLPSLRPGPYYPSKVAILNHITAHSNPYIALSTSFLTLYQSALLSAYS